MKKKDIDAITEEIKYLDVWRSRVRNPKTSQVGIGRYDTISEILCKLVGSAEKARIIQITHDWCNQPEAKVIEGHAWFHYTLKQWENRFSYLSKNSIQRYIKELEESGLLISGVFNKMRNDRTKWYRLDYTLLHEEMLKILAEDEVFGDVVRSPQIGDIHFPKLGTSISPELGNHYKNNTKNNTKQEIVIETNSVSSSSPVSEDRSKGKTYTFRPFKEIQAPPLGITPSGTWEPGAYEKLEEIFFREFVCYLEADGVIPRSLWTHMFHRVMQEIKDFYRRGNVPREKSYSKVCYEYFAQRYKSQAYGALIYDFLSTLAMEAADLKTYTPKNLKKEIDKIHTIRRALKSKVEDIKEYFNHVADTSGDASPLQKYHYMLNVNRAKEYTQYTRGWF
jgi:hypothetical protein